MTLLGKLLTKLGAVSPDLESRLLKGVEQYRAEKRKQWAERADRVKNSSRDRDWDRGACLTLLGRQFNKTRLHRLYGWNLVFIPNNDVRGKYGDPLVRIALNNRKHPDYIGPITMNLYYYDVERFLRACNQIVGRDQAELQWLLKEATRVAQKRSSLLWPR